MSERYKPKKLAPVDGLVFVFVCLFFLAVLPPACRKSRFDSARITCARNLSEIGRAMLIYANDYDGELPRAGGRYALWGARISNWLADNRFGAYGLRPDGSGGQATITSSLYLLVKYAGVAPKSFVCPGDTGTTAFDPADDGAGDRDLVDLWDFGLGPSEHCSYSYHMPYCLYPLTTSEEPGMAVVADRNPWIESPAARGKVDMIVVFNPDGDRDAVKAGNALAHQEEGQNVLFLDGHVSFEDRAFCGVNDDNIYTFWTGGDIRRGGMPLPGACEPADRLDSFLVHDPPAYTRKTTKQPEAIDSANLKQTSVVATLDCSVPEHRNVIWCSTFQMAWDRLKDDIIGEPVEVLGADELAARLNQAKVSETDLEAESFYATAGFVPDGIIEQIQQEMARRFPSEPVPVFDERYRKLPQPTIVTYSYLNVDVGFKYPFYTKNTAFSFEDSNGTRTDVTSFCNYTTGSAPNLSLVREQVDILYYKYAEQPSDAEFAVDLCKDTQPYQVVLARVPRCNTLAEAVADVEEKISEFKRDPEYEVLSKLRPIDRLIVPDVLYKLMHHFAELEGKGLGNQPWRDQGYFILEAMQMIDFALSRTGVTVKSWSRIVAPPFASQFRRIEEPRHLYFNRPFLVYVKKRGPDYSPFFVMWVDNAELMKKF